MKKKLLPLIFDESRHLGRSFPVLDSFEDSQDELRKVTLRHSVHKILQKIEKIIREK